jgi:hypothetical protein
MSIQFTDPLCLDVPWTTVAEFNEFPNMSSEHVEANHRRMIRIVKHQCVQLGFRVVVAASTPRKLSEGNLQLSEADRPSLATRHDGQG